jgi:hypothetical protein
MEFNTPQKGAVHPQNCTDFTYGVVVFTREGGKFDTIRDTYE